jgi:hypothetical protein
MLHNVVVQKPSVIIRTAVTALLATGAVVTTVVAGPLSTASATDAAGTITLPPDPNDSAMPVSGLLGSPGGVSFELLDGTANPTVYTRALGSASRVNSGLVERVGMSLVGNQLVVGHPVAGGGYRATAVDITTETKTDLADYQTSSGNAADYFVTGTGDGWLDVEDNANTYTLTRHVIGGATTALTTVPAGAILDAAADTSSVLLSTYDIQTSKYTVKYIDFGSQHVTTLSAGSTSAVQAVALSPSSAAILSAGAIVRWQRSAPSGSPTSRTVPYSTRSIAITDAATAWVDDAPYNQAGDTAPHVYSAVGSGAAHEIAGPYQGTTVTAIDAGDFAAIFGNTATTRAITRFHPGATTPAAVIESTGADTPASVDAGPGRLAYASSTPNADPAVHIHTVLRTDSTLTTPGNSSTIGAPSQLNVPVAFSGGHSAHLEMDLNGNCTAVVDDGAKEIARIPASHYCDGVGLTGQRLLIEEGAPDGTSYGSSRLIDLNTRAVTAEPDTSAIFGSRLVYMRRDGTVLLRDLNMPGSTDRVVRPAGIPVGATLIGGNRSLLQVHGDWAMWGIRGDDGSMLELKAQTLRNLTTPATDLTAPIDEAVLGDGVVATLSATDHTVDSILLPRLYDNTVYSAFVGTSRPAAANRHWLAMTDEFIAYVADDATTHLALMPWNPDAPPRTLGVVAKATVETGAIYSPVVDTTRPLTSWTFTIRDSHGTVVGQQTGAAPDGSARPTWNGRTSGGGLAPVGTYTWTLSGIGGGPSGFLTDDTGFQTPATGTVLVTNGDGFHPVPQARVFNSGSSPLRAGADRDIAITNHGGVPANADAVLVNVEVQSPSSSGYLRVTPGGTSSSTAVQEFSAGQTISNLVAVKLAANGTIRLHLSAGSATVFADVAGYFTTGG